MLQIIVNILISMFTYLVVALSFQLTYQTVKFFNIAHAVVITFGAYFTYMFSQQLGMNILFAIPLAVLSSSGIGVLLEISIFRPLRKRNAQPFIILIASLGLYTILQNVISLCWKSGTKSFRTGEVKVGNEFLGAYITNTQIGIILASLILFIAVVVFMQRTAIGKNMRAVSSNESLSNILGINSDKTIHWAFLISSALASVSGILVAFDTDLNPNMGFNLLLYGIVAMIIGGVGSYWGLIGGALLLAAAQHLAAFYIDSKWMDAIAYVILILFLLWKPLGFSGKRLKKVEI
jgi:branched-subunit amino acid ABC-type transport system permease component